MGKVLLEFLLRKCDQVNKIYVLIRMKKGGKRENIVMMRSFERSVKNDEICSKI